MSDPLFFYSGCAILVLNLLINLRQSRTNKRNNDLLRQCKSTNDDIRANIKVSKRLFDEIAAICKEHPELWGKVNKELLNMTLN